ncbi:MAG: Pr6Pr family membrane protein [Ginsengibacter sp.]
MNNSSSVVKKIYLTVFAIAVWVALAGQLYLIIQNRTVSVISTIIRYISFFTILTNLLVALCVPTLLQKRNDNGMNFFSRRKTITAIAVYITIVGLVYNLVLRFLWQPQGLQLVVDELLHSVVPLLFVFYWLFFVPSAGLKAKDILPWLLYPLAYLIYTLIRGAITGLYPYPFIDVVQLGYNKVLFNSGVLVIVFVIFSLLFVWMDSLKRTNSSRLAA